MLFETVEEVFQLGACVPHGLGRVSTEGTGIASFSIDFSLDEPVTEGLLLKEISLLFPAAIKINTLPPRSVTSANGSKKFTYELKDLAQFGPTTYFSKITHAILSGWFTKPLLGWEIFQASTQTVPERAEGKEAVFDSTLEIKASEGIDHLYGSMHWPRVSGSQIAQRFLSTDGAEADEGNQSVYFPQRQFPQAGNPLSKGQKKSCKMSVRYSSVEGLRGAMSSARPPCEIVAAVASVTGTRRTSPEDIPIKIHSNELSISRSLHSQMVSMQTIIQYFAEISPSY